MADKLKRASLGIAVVGIGQLWTDVYRNIVRKMSAKVDVRAVCDPVHARAAAAASEFDALPYSSLQPLRHRSDIKAWLILDTDWFANHPLEIAVQHGVPALLANVFAYEPRHLQGLAASTSSGFMQVVPELPRRFTPATTRLRELIATKLGPATSIEIVASFTSPQLLVDGSSSDAPKHGSLAEALDWCSYVTGQRVTEPKSFSGGSSFQRQVLFGSNHSTAEAPVVANLIDAGVIETTGHPYLARVICRDGIFTIKASDQVMWVTATEQCEECLVNERPAHELVLDQFCRRAAGGLIPTPTMEDVLATMMFAGSSTDTSSLAD